MTKRRQTYARTGARRWFTREARDLGLKITRRRGKVWYFIGGGVTPNGTNRVQALRYGDYLLKHEHYQP